jgi:hypothetical protein
MVAPLVCYNQPLIFREFAQLTERLVGVDLEIHAAVVLIGLSLLK